MRSLALLIWLLAAVSAAAQPVVDRVRFTGNEAVDGTTLLTLVRTQQNRELFSIPGFKLWLWLNNLNTRWGEEPTLLDRTVVGADIIRLQTYYRSIGYLDAEVDTIVAAFGPNRVEVSFLIREGRQTRIRRVAYSGLPEFDNPDVMARYFRRSTLVERQIDDTTFATDQPLTYERIGAERQALTDLLKNQGYASVVYDSVRAIVARDSTNPYRVDLLYLVYPGRVYTFGDVYLNLEGPGMGFDTMRMDTLEGPPHTTNGTRIIMRKEDEALSRFRLLYGNVMFTPGERYNHDRYLRTIRRYQNLGMVNVRQFSLNEDGGLPDFSGEALPVRVDLQTIPRQRIRMDVFGMQRFGFGAGAGITYSNNNLFGNAELLEVSAKGSFENAPQVAEGLLQSAEASVNYSVPRLNFPFRSFNDRDFYVQSRTLYGITLARINQLNFTVNANIRFNMRYTVQHRANLQSELDLLELDWLDASPSQRFRDQLENNENLDPLQVELILNDFSQQFGSNLRYTHRMLNTDLVRRNRGFYNEMSIETGGNIPFLIERYLVRPGEPLQGTIPSFTASDTTLSYSRFIKATLDHRRYWPVTETTVIGWRFFGGMAYAYGTSPTIPLNRRFFAGGSNDIRGWAPLRLGPGSVPNNQVTFNGGDIKLASFLEVRQLLLRNFLSTDWHAAFFADTGNIWYGPRSQFREGRFRADRFHQELAVGIGYGVRLDWEYVIFRIDAAYRAIDPSVPGGFGDKWLQDRRPYIHFGIGHTF